MELPAKLFDLSDVAFAKEGEDAPLVPCGKSVKCRLDLDYVICFKSGYDTLNFVFGNE